MGLILFHDPNPCRTPAALGPRVRKVIITPPNQPPSSTRGSGHTIARGPSLGLRLNAPTSSHLRPGRALSVPVKPVVVAQRYLLTWPHAEFHLTEYESAGSFLGIRPKHRLGLTSGIPLSLIKLRLTLVKDQNKVKKGCLKHSDFSFYIKLYEKKGKERKIGILKDRHSDIASGLIRCVSRELGCRGKGGGEQRSEQRDT